MYSRGDFYQERLLAVRQENGVNARSECSDPAGCSVVFCSPRCRRREAAYSGTGAPTRDLTNAAKTLMSTDAITSLNCCSVS